ncbi:LTA synthase family protein [Serpentinicella sp. ANB-PHB4]|uniref:LTA synthase family protein n=1 Tax=Serpentinicella sp. ANB-PHB4 TaxID=3074076 RepID=UPI002856F485|nr:LTA synthase family protein [Serpentinicella sp. ANB-PHB4]MDR5658502.1 LTA synthase family protein [Serpentinicella sp. ANB-PHB4]
MQVLDFWRDILQVITQNLLWIILLFLPLLFFFIFKNSYFTFSKLQFKYSILFILPIVGIYLIGLLTLSADGKGLNSAHSLYYTSSNPALSTEKLGLLTTMRLDVQRSVTGWSPSYEITSNPIPTEPDIEYDAMEDDEYDYNVMDIDFKSLMENESNSEIKQMHQYFKNVSPTQKNEYTGKYADYNLILITAEAFSPMAVRKDITPTLYKMVHEGYNFTNFYVPLWDVSTSDGEYVALTSLIPKSGVWSFRESSNIELPFVMGNQLKNAGYKTMAYHNHTYSFYRRDLSHPNMGYDYKGIGNGLDVEEIWPASDLEMMEVSVGEYINDVPFHAYYMTVSGHLQYNFMGNNMAAKNRHYVEDLPYSEQGRAYLATQIELDKALDHLLNELDKAGVADNTLIALSSDHYPYGLDHEVIDELTGHYVERDFELYRSPFILYTQNMDSKTIDKPVSSLDIIPTLSNLLGLEYDSRLLMGNDMFSDADPLVIFRNHSFITEKGYYNAETEEFISTNSATVDEDYIERMLNIVGSKFYYSAKILDTDYYSIVLEGIE